MLIFQNTLFIFCHWLSIIVCNSSSEFTPNNKPEKCIFRFIFLTVQGSPIDYVQRLSENMQLYAEEDYLTGDCLYFEYDADVSINNLFS